jgi:hypothetical protein
MITGPLFKWFGSKWLTSKHYPTPKHDTIVEPFAGGAGYSLRYCDRAVFLAERDIHIRRLWWWLISEARESDIRELPINIPEGTDIRTLGLSLGQSLLIKSWQRTNNVGDCWTVSAWGNKPGQWTANTRARVASEFHQIKHWHVVEDGMRLLNATCEPCTWFIDPPYQFNYQYRSSPIDYTTLATTVETLSGQTIVCEALCQKTGARPTWLPFVDFRRTVTSRRKANANHHSRELIYTNER